MTIPAAPADKSGGYFKIRATNGTDTHTSQWHVTQFATGQFIRQSDGTTVTGDDGNHDYAYVVAGWGGAGEKGVGDTITALITKLKAFYPATWTLRPVSLYQVVNNVATQVFPIPNVAPVSGTNTDTDRTDQYRAFEQTYTMNGKNGGRGGFIIIGPPQTTANAVPAAITGTSGGTATEMGMVAYMSSATTAICAHDGSQFNNFARRTGCFNRRKRRTIGFA